jgi:hypothetical protein
MTPEIKGINEEFENITITETLENQETSEASEHRNKLSKCLSEESY